MTASTVAASTYSSLKTTLRQLPIMQRAPTRSWAHLPSISPCGHLVFSEKRAPRNPAVYHLFPLRPSIGHSSSQRVSSRA